MVQQNKIAYLVLMLAFGSLVVCQVNDQITDFTYELTQPQLFSGNSEATLWGQNKDRFKRCAVEDKYYDIIQNTWTMTKNFKDTRAITTAHDGLIVSFSYVFVNFDTTFVGESVASTIYFDDTNARAFKSTIGTQNLGCGYNGYDSAGSLTVYIPHTSANLKVFIDAALHGADQKLGVRDLSIKTVKCAGSNFYFSSLDGKCYCNLGYKQVKQTVNGTVTKTCVHV